MNSNTDIKARIISRDTIYKSKYFYVEKRNVEENGKILTKDYVIRTPAVFILPITEEDEVYVARQYRSALEKFTLELFAGHLDEGEEPLVAAKRELAEESGLTAGYWKHLSTWNIAANTIAVIDIFLAKDLAQGKAHLDTDEHVEALKIPFTSLIEKVKNGEIDTAPHIAAILFVDMLRREGKV